MRFTNKDLKNMIVPLFFEQLLVMLVGIADTLVISYAGESAVSGVSLVNQFNTIFIYIFTALASGGAVVVSQYIGSGDKDNAEKSSSQLLMFSVLLSLLIGALVIIGNRAMLGLLFGSVEGSVMEISILSNIIKVVGNIIGVFGMKAGVAGVAYPSLIARAFSAVAITYLCFRQEAELHYQTKWIFAWDGGMLKKILNIAVPNGVENGLFQLVKVALSSIVALFGTYQIAANGVAQSIWSLAALMGVAMSSAFIPVIGQCMGAGDTDEAEYYFKKLMKITVTASVAWNAIILAATPFMMMAYNLSAETKQLVIWLVVIHNVFNALAFPFSGALSAGLRATGDVKFTMAVTVISTIGIRLLLSVLFGIVLDMGVIGIALAMCTDWLFKGVLFEIRLRKGTWKQFQVI